MLRNGYDCRFNDKTDCILPISNQIPGAKMIAAVSKELNELKKQVSQQKVEIEEQRADRRQLHKDVANLKDENMEFRKTQAILRDAEIKLHEADNEFRVADARIFKDTEKEAEKKQQMSGGNRDATQWTRSQRRK